MITKIVINREKNDLKIAPHLSESLPGAVPVVSALVPLWAGRVASVAALARGAAVSQRGLGFLHGILGVWKRKQG